jgi:hypothetical protein
MDLREIGVKMWTGSGSGKDLERSFKFTSVLQVYMLKQEYKKTSDRA